MSEAVVRIIRVIRVIEVIRVIRARCKPERVLHSARGDVRPTVCREVFRDIKAFLDETACEVMLVQFCPDWPTDSELHKTKYFRCLTSTFGTVQLKFKERYIK